MRLSQSVHRIASAIYQKKVCTSSSLPFPSQPKSNPPSPQARNQSPARNNAPDAYGLHHCIRVPNRPILLNSRHRRRPQQQLFHLPHGRNLPPSNGQQHRRYRTNLRTLPRYIPHANRHNHHRGPNVVELSPGQRDPVLIILLQDSSHA